MNHFSDSLLVKKINQLISVLEHNIVVSDAAIDDVFFVTDGYTKTNRPPENANWQRLDKQCDLEQDTHYWFRFTVTTPKILKDEAVFLSVHANRDTRYDKAPEQSLLFLNGEIVQGLDAYHHDVLVAPETTYEVLVYTYSGICVNAQNRLCTSVTVKNKEVEGLYYDLKVPFEAALLFDVDSKNHIDIMPALDNAIRKVDMRDFTSDAFLASVKAARNVLEKEFYQEICGKNVPAEIACIGHTHIDVAWLWTLAQTCEKAQRSFSTVIKLMEEYPEYLFMSSQPQLYKYVKLNAPQVYEKIKQRVKEGRFEPEGGMWVEADCNITGGESLVRQFLLGKQFMKEEFGVDNKILWLPDVFGYSAALPQILKKCGIDTFVTSKISWNDTNRMPYDAFLWQGIDGTEMFTYFITAQDTEKAYDEPKTYSTYVGNITPKMAMGTWNRFEHKGYSNEACITYGYGDGGGGPTREMLEYQRRLSRGIPGVPKTKTDTATAFLGRVKESYYKNAEETGRYPRWCGELYLEFHRGTYTTMARNKNYNRRSEFLLKKTEGLSATATKLLGEAYPKAQLHDAWELVCLNQFHDIIPGSSIFEVYEDSKAQYEEVLATGNALSNKALSALTQNIAADTDGVLVYNPHSFAFCGAIEIGGKMQTVENIPAFGWTVVEKTDEESAVTVTESTLENQYYNITFENGDIVSLIDKRANRELIKAGTRANRLCFHEDFPYNYDAWEISKYYQDKCYDYDRLVSVEPVFEGARAGLKIVKTFGKSTVTQTIYLYNEDERIDFHTEVEWQEEHMLLKALFPLDLHTNEATYEIQYGSVKRPTHSNTSWDEARFEVCAQKWIDLSEETYGVSVLNDCKYGYGVEGSDVTISLLRAPTYPNPKADRGHHEFTYSLLPHNCSLSESNTIKESYKLNDAPVVCNIKKQAGTLPKTYSFVSVDTDRVMVEAVKQAENGDGTIFRLFCHGNARENVTVTFGFPVERVALCNLLEQEEGTLEPTNNTVSFEMKPFEIVTLKVK